MKNTLTIGKFVRKIREDNDLSLGELSKLSGVGKTTISDLENGRTVPSVVTLFLLLDTFVNNIAKKFNFNY